jgi:hypothetical protein
VTARPKPPGGRPALLTWLLLLVGLVAGPAGPAAAQPVTADSDVRLVLSSISGVLGPSSLVLGEDDPLERPEPPLDLELRLLVENAGPEAIDSLRVVFELYPAADRAALTSAFEGEPEGQPHVHELPVRDGEPLEPGAVAGVSHVVEHDEADVWADDGGVHPLRLTVVRGAELLAQTTTAVVWVGAPVADPLLTTFVWPFDDRPWRTVQGAYVAEADRAIQPGGRLDTLLRTLERRQDVGVVLAPAAELLEDLRDRADGFTALERQPDGSMEAREIEPEDREARRANDTLARVREVAQDLRHPPVTGTYAAADLQALRAADLADLAGEAAVEGRRRLAQVLDRAPDAGTHLVGGHLDPAVLDLLPGDQLLLPPEAVEEEDDGDGPGAGLRPLRSAAGRALTGIVADRRLTAAMAAAPGPAGPVADAQRLVAETAAAYFEHPHVDARPLLVLPPEGWDPSPELVTELLDALTDAPWIELTTPTALAASGHRGTQPLTLAELDAEPLSPALARSLGETSQALAAARGAVTVEAPLIGDRSPRELHDTLLRATSRWYRGAGEGDADALVRDVRRAVDETFGDVVVASGTRVTLTSDSGQIPVTLQRTRGGPITVRVEVTSQGRLVWPDGRRSETLVLTDGLAQTVSFRTRALSTGTFPVTVRVTDPSGQHEIERTTLSVRSTAISGPALSATGLAVLALLIAGALRRRPRRHRLEVVE